MTSPPPHRRGAATASERSSASPSSRSTAWQDVDSASTVLSRMVAGPLTWGGIGWLLDRWLGTDPWLLAFGVMAGFLGSLYLVWRTSTIQRPIRKPGEPAVGQKDQPS